MKFEGFGLAVLQVHLQNIGQEEKRVSLETINETWIRKKACHHVLMKTNIPTTNVLSCNAARGHGWLVQNY